MRGNLDFFLRRQSQEAQDESSRQRRDVDQEFAEDFA
jgi:hypothetical protein